MLPGAPGCAFQSLCLGAGFSECQPWLVFGAGAEPGEPLLDLSTRWLCAPSAAFLDLNSSTVLPGGEK